MSTPNIKNTKGNSNRTYALSIMVTQNCNMECKYCFSYDNKKETSMDQNKFISLMEHEVNLISKKQELDIIMIEFFGGEPLIKFNLIEKLLEALTRIDHRVRFKIPTNLLLMNRYIYDTLKKYNTNIIFSFDGLWTDIQRPQLNSRSALEQYIKRIKEIKSYDLRTCHCMIYPSGINSSTILENYLWIKNNLNLEPDMVLVRDNKVWSDSNTDLCIKQLKELMYYTLKTDADIIPTIFSSHIIKIINLKIKGFKTKYCGITQDKKLISYDGKEYPCNIFIGKSIDYSPDELIIKLDKALHNTKCENCVIRDLCDKGCPVQIMENGFTQEDNLCTLFIELNRIATLFLIYAEANPKSGIAKAIENLLKIEGI